MSTLGEDKRTLRVQADLTDLAEIRRFVQQTAVALDVDPSAIYDIVLVVNELVTNIIVHGYAGKPGPIEIKIQPQGDALIIHLYDEAPPFDPTLVPSPDISLPLEKRPFGGMGVHLTREFMDRFTYQVTAQGGNEVKLVKEGVRQYVRKENSDGDDN